MPCRCCAPRPNRVLAIAIELLIDTGRRPSEILNLPLGLSRPRPRRQLCAGLRRPQEQQAGPAASDHPGNRRADQRPTTCNPGTVPRSADQPLLLLPSDQQTAHRPAADGATQHRPGPPRAGSLRCPHPLLRADGSTYDPDTITPYSYRHTYAQRHADAGVPLDVLAELMGHELLSSTQAYYQVSEKRRRAAVDRLADHQFDRHGNQLWRDTQALLDHEHARHALGQVSVPYGTCHEPSNVQAGGGACPFRFRCVGCDHFRTDASHLPELKAYLQDLLRDRERTLATTDLDDWARTEAFPSDEEIRRVKELIHRVEEHLDQLTPAEQADITAAISAVRRTRQTTSLGMPPSAAARSTRGDPGGP